MNAEQRTINFLGLSIYNYKLNAFTSIVGIYLLGIFLTWYLTGIFKIPLPEDVSLKSLTTITKSFIPIGAGSDHMSFKSFSKKAQINTFEVACFLSIKDGKYIHSAKDIAANCDKNNLNGCIDICYNAARSLDLRL